jgi:hypothetical protein
MQISIDTDNMTIEIDGIVSIRELLNTLKVLNIDKEKWSLKAKTKTVYEKTIPWIQPYVQPWTNPYRTTPWFEVLQPYTYNTNLNLDPLNTILTCTNSTGSYSMSNRNCTLNIKEQE